MRYKVVRPQTTVEQIKAVINSDKQTMFPIVSRDEKFLGFVLEQDIANLAANTTAVEARSAAELQGKSRVISVHDDDPLDKAMIAMTANCLPFVPVVKPDGRYVGTVDANALASAARVFK